MLTSHLSNHQSQSHQRKSPDQKVQVQQKIAHKRSQDGAKRRERIRAQQKKLPVPKRKRPVQVQRKKKRDGVRRKPLLSLNLLLRKKNKRKSSQRKT